MNKIIINLNSIAAILILFVGLFYLSYALGALRDPTQPPAIPEQPVAGQFTSIELTAIISSDQGRYAVINGKIVKTGDEILGNKVIAINKTGVELSGVNGKMTLFLLGKSVKTPVN